MCVLVGFLKCVGDVESYIARFNAIAKTVDATYTTPVGLAQLMVIGMQSNTALYQDMLTVQPEGGYRTITEVMQGY